MGLGGLLGRGRAREAVRQAKAIIAKAPSVAEGTETSIVIHLANLANYLAAARDEAADPEVTRESKEGLIADLDAFKLTYNNLYNDSPVTVEGNRLIDQAIADAQALEVTS